MLSNKYVNIILQIAPNHTILCLNSIPGSFHVNSTTDFGSCSQIYLPLPIFVGHDVLCTFTKYCVLNDVCLQNMAL